MLGQGKQLTTEAIEMVVRLKNHHDQERQKAKVVSTKDSVGRTAAGLGINTTTVKRLMADYKRNGNKVVVQPAVRPGRPPSAIGQNMQLIVRRFIRGENLAGQRVSLEKL